MLIAHRGKVVKGIKENSIKAFKEAFADDKYIGIECDIRESKDGILVINHNPISEGKIIKITDYRHLNLPRLRELLRIKTDKILLIEIKDGQMNLSKLVKMLNKSKRNIYVMSFYRKVIKELSKYTRKFKVGVLNYVLNSEDSYSDYDFICLLNDVVTDKLLDWFKNKKIEVIIYGVYKKDKLREDLWYIVDDANF